MTTPTTMTTSMITTVTTMMTNVVVAPSLGSLLEGCVLLLELTETVPVVVIALSVLDAEVPPSAEQKHTIWRETRNKETQKHSSEGNKHMVLHVVQSKSSSNLFMVYSLVDNKNDFSMIL